MRDINSREFGPMIPMVAKPALASNTAAAFPLAARRNIAKVLV